jgi:site-specific recombinase XerD
MKRRRRSAGDGSLYYREDKQLWVAQHEGVYRYSKDKDKAREKLHKLLAQAEEIKLENITVERYMDQWFEYAKPNLKLATIKRYGEAIEVHIKPALVANTKLHTVEARTVQNMYSGMLRNGLSPSTINIVHSVLSSAFKRAAKWQLVGHNIMRDVDAPKVHRKEVEGHPQKYGASSQQHVQRR